MSDNLTAAGNMYIVEHLCDFAHTGFVSGQDETVQAWVPQDPPAVGTYPEAAFRTWFDEHGYERDGRFRLIEMAPEFGRPCVIEFTVVSRTVFDVERVEHKRVAA